MRAFLFVLAASLYGALVSADAAESITEEENVLVLTTQNFDQAVKTYNHLLVEFYAPWCGHCKALAPEYAKAATTLKSQQSAVRLGKVDATLQAELGERFKIRGYPTLKFFVDGTPVEYGGGRTADEIVQWVVKKSGPPAALVATVADLNKLRDANEVAVLGLFKSDAADNEALALFNTVAKSVDSVAFGVTHDAAIFAELGLDKDQHIVLFKKFDEGRVEFTEQLTADDLKKIRSLKSVAIGRRIQPRNSPKDLWR